MNANRGALRTLSMAAASALALIAGVSPTHAQTEPASFEAPRVEFNIPAQPLATAISDFSRQARISVVTTSAAVRGKHANAVVGEMSPEEALRRLTDGSGLTVARTGDGGLTLTQEQTPSPTRLGAATNAAPSENEEIIVTAQKREERIQDVAAPVTVVDTAQLTDTGQTRLEDFYNRVPGLSLGLAGDGGTPTVSMRGITTGGDANATVGVIIDDISYGASVTVGTGYGVTAPDLDPGDIARIEVLRGPQGTLYGASSMGGVLKYVTVDPTTEDFGGRVQVGTSSVEHGDGLGHLFRGSINIPLSDQFALRLSGFDLEDPGYIDNVETGEEDANGRESSGGRLALLWTPSDALSVRLSALVQETTRLGSSESDTNLDEEFQQAFLTGTGVSTRNSEAYNATIVGTLAGIEITSATGYSTDESIVDVDLTHCCFGYLAGQANTNYGVNRAVQASETSVEKITQELRFDIPLSERVNLLAGLFYTEETGRLAGELSAFDDDATEAGLLFGLDYGPNKFEERAIFSTLTVDITDRIDIQIGGRYSENSQSGAIVWTGPMAQSVFGENPHFADVDESEDNSFTYLITPRFRVTPDFMLYARLASGYRPGGFNNGCGHPEVPCTFEPDTTRNYDIGAKGNLFNGIVSYDASIYFIDWRNIQVPNLYPSDFAFAYTANVARAESQGVELSLEARPTDGLSLGAWVAHNDATLAADFPLPEATFVSGETGDRLPYGAEWTGALSADWQFPIFGQFDGFVGGTASFTGERQGGFESIGVERATLGSYWQVNLSAGLRSEAWNLTFFANNVLDERGGLRGGADSAFFTNYVTFIQPRVVGLTIARDF